MANSSPMTVMIPAETSGKRFTTVHGGCKAEEQAGWRRKWLGPGSLRWSLALFDQAVVSGSRFLITILVGKAGGPSELGDYALAFSVLVLLGCVQEALITTPFAIFSNRLRGRSRRSIGAAAAAMHGLFLALVAASALGIAGLLWMAMPDSRATRIAALLAVTAPLSILWEFTRRMLLAELKIGQAALLDATVATLQIASLIVLAHFDRLNAVSGLAAVGAGCAIPSGLCLILWMRRLSPPRHLLLYWGRNWQFGKWLMGSQVVRAATGSLPIWLVATLAGDLAAGVFSACLNLAMICNPFIFAIGNLLMPKAAQEYARHGMHGMLRLIGRATIGMAVVLVPFGLTLMLGGDALLQWTYGSRYTGHALELGLLGVLPVVWSTTSALACGLSVIRQPRSAFVATMMGTLVIAVTVALLVPRWQITGAVTGLLLGSLTTCLAHAWYFWHGSRELSENSP